MASMEYMVTVLIILWSVTKMGFIIKDYTVLILQIKQKLRAI